MKILRTYLNSLHDGWSYGLIQAAMLLFSPVPILLVAKAIPFPVKPGNVGDAVMAFWFLIAMTTLVFLSASRAARMRQVLERLPLNAGSFKHMAGLLVVTLGCVLLVSLYGGLVRQALDETQRIYGHTDLARAWSYDAMRTLLGVWLLLLGYRFKLVWDALIAQLDPGKRVAVHDAAPAEGIA